MNITNFYQEEMRVHAALKLYFRVQTALTGRCTFIFRIRMLP